MGALPSCEANESPSSLLACNCGNRVMCYVPLTPHYFPSHDCLAFKQLFHARNNQSALYAFDLRDVEGHLPQADAVMFRDAQREDWGPEVDEIDPSLHYYDTDTADTNAKEDDQTPSVKRHIRASVERVCDLYDVLVRAPTADGRLVATNAEMCALRAQEHKWRASLEAYHCSGGADCPKPVVEQPPARFLNPLLEAVALRLTLEEEEEMRKEYLEKQHVSMDDSTCSVHPMSIDLIMTNENHPSHGTQFSLSDTSDNDESETRLVNGVPMVRRHRYRFEDVEAYKDGRVHLVEEDGVLLHFAYNPNFVPTQETRVTADANGTTVWEPCRHEVLLGGDAAASGHSNGTQQTGWCVRCGQEVTRKLDHRDVTPYAISADSTQEFLVPINALRIVGAHGPLPAESRGTPWLRGTEGSEALDAAIESSANRPDVLRLCRFVDGAIGEKTLNRAALLSLLMFRRMCLHAGLPAPITRPLWSTCMMSNIPYLQMVRETFFRVRAAVAEVEDGDNSLAEWLEQVDQKNNYLNFINSNLHVFCDCTPKEVAGPSNADNDDNQEQQYSSAATSPFMRCNGADAASDNGSGVDAQYNKNIRRGGPNKKGAEESKDYVGGSTSPSKPNFKLFSTRLEPHSDVILDDMFSPNSVKWYADQSRHPSDASVPPPYIRQDGKAAASVKVGDDNCCSTSSGSQEAESVRHLRAVREGGIVDTVRGRSILFRIREDALAALCYYCSKASAPIFIGAYLESTDTQHVSYAGAVRLTPGSDADVIENIPEDTATIASYKQKGITVTYSVSDPSGHAAGPSAAHRTRRLVPVLPESIHRDMNQTDKREQTGYVSSYPKGHFRDGDLVVFNCDSRAWEHYEHVQLRRRYERLLAAQGYTNASLSSPHAVDAETSLWLHADERLDDTMASRLLCVGLDELMLSWTKWVVDNRFYENRHDPGWLTEHADSRFFISVGRYFIWSFRLNRQRFFYGVIPRFVKDRIRRQRVAMQKKKKQDQDAAAASTASVTTLGFINDSHSSSVSVSNTRKGRKKNKNSNNNIDDSNNKSTTSSQPHAVIQLGSSPAELSIPSAMVSSAPHQRSARHSDVQRPPPLFVDTYTRHKMDSTCTASPSSPDGGPSSRHHNSTYHLYSGNTFIQENKKGEHRYYTGGLPHVTVLRNNPLYNNGHSFNTFAGGNGLNVLNVHVRMRRHGSSVLSSSIASSVMPSTPPSMPLTPLHDGSARGLDSTSAPGLHGHPLLETGSRGGSCPVVVTSFVGNMVDSNHQHHQHGLHVTERSGSTHSHQNTTGGGETTPHRTRGTGTFRWNPYGET